MNGKTVKKLLMKGRTQSLWGKRAYLTVRLPTSAVCSTPRPEPLTFPGLQPRRFEGLWGNEDDSESVTIHKVSANFDPRTKPEEGTARYFPTLKYETDGYQSWEWWEGYRTVGSEQESLSEALVGQYKAFREWFDALHEYGHNHLRDRLLEAGNYAKATYWHTDESGENILVQFGVKWFYPDRKFGFSASLSHAVKAAKKAGIPVRVLQ